MKTIAIALTLAVFAQQHTGMRVLATSFTHMAGPDAKYNGDQFFCYKKPGTNRWSYPGVRGYVYTKMNGNEVGVAHRQLPCGTLVEITYGKRRILVPIVDRGPYWAVRVECVHHTRKRQWSKAAQACWRDGQPLIHLAPGWVHVGELDITRLAAKRLGLPGRGLVRYRVVPRVLKRITRQQGD